MEPRKVLVVGDPSGDDAPYESVFGKSGCFVRTANLLEALKKLAGNTEIDLVILDIKDRWKEAVEMIRQKREESARKEIRVIVTGRSGIKDDLLFNLGLGADAYVEKPWTPSRLKQVIYRLPPCSHHQEGAETSGGAGC